MEPAQLDFWEKPSTAPQTLANQSTRFFPTDWQESEEEEEVDWEESDEEEAATETDGGEEEEEDEEARESSDQEREVGSKSHRRIGAGGVAGEETANHPRSLMCILVPI